MARFDRRRYEARRVSCKHQVSDKSVGESHQKKPMGRSYADVVRAVKHISKSPNDVPSRREEEKVVHFHSKEFVAALGCMLIGECKRYDFLLNLHENFFEEGWGDISLSFLGGFVRRPPFPS